MENKRTFEEKVILVLFISLTVLSIVQVIMRYIIGQSLGWSEEAMRYIYVWMCLLGISAAVKNNNHIKIVMLVNLLPEKVRKWIDLAGDLLFTLVSLIFILYGVRMVLGFWEFPQKSPAMEIPLAYIYAALPLGFFLTCLRMLQKYINRFKANKGVQQ